jgi:hypothetical protein
LVLYNLFFFFREDTPGIGAAVSKNHKRLIIRRRFFLSYRLFPLWNIREGIKFRDQKVLFGFSPAFLTLSKSSAFGFAKRPEELMLLKPYFLTFPLVFTPKCYGPSLFAFWLRQKRWFSLENQAKIWSVLSIRYLEIGRPISVECTFTLYLDYLAPFFVSLDLCH